MDAKHATVKGQVIGGAVTAPGLSATAAPDRPTGKTAEEIRVELAEAGARFLTSLGLEVR